MKTAVHGLIQYHSPDDTAIYFKDQAISYSSLLTSIERMAHGLLDAGIRPGDRVALFLLNCPELIIAYYACWQIGAIATPLNSRLKGPEIARIIGQVTPSLIISDNNLLGELRRACSDTHFNLKNCYIVENTSKTISSFSQLLTTTLHEEPVFDEKIDALIQFTSGTTANPKPVVTALGHIQNMARDSAHILHYKKQDDNLVALSLAHGFAFSMQMLPTFYSGATLTLLEKFDAKQVFNKITSNDISGTCLLPGMCLQLVQLAEQDHSFHHHLHFCLVAGDALPMALQTRFQKVFGMPITANYGCTESSLASLMPLNKAEKLGAIGLPIVGDINIVDDNNKTLAAGKTGEIVINNNSMMAYYWGLPELTKDVMKGGWFHTGDLGMFDEDGYLWFKGRKKLVIIRGGSNVSPQEVEAACYQHPDILEAGVTGVDDNKLNQRVAAFIVTMPDSTLDEASLTTFLAEQIADYKIPEKISFVDTLPKTGVGKIDRAALATMASKQKITAPA